MQRPRPRRRRGVLPAPSPSATTGGLRGPRGPSPTTGARAAAGARGGGGLPPAPSAIRNTRSAVEPVLTFADNRDLRRRVFTAFTNRGDNANANDTNAIISKVVKLRADRAKLLGFT